MNNKKGSILIVTLGFILIFTLLGLAAMHLAGLQNEAAVKQNYSTKAFWLADAGIQVAKKRINANACQEFRQYDLAVGGLCDGAMCGAGSNSCKNCGANEKCLVETFSSNGVIIGDYVAVVNNSNTVIISTGSAYASSAVADIQKQKRKIRVTGSPFLFAIFGINGVIMGNNNSVDSYDSSKLKSDGTPCTYGQTCADGEVNIGAEGDVGTNGIVPDVITLGSNSSISGDVSTGVGGTVSPSSIPATHDNDIEFPQIVLPADFVASNSSGTFSDSVPATLGSGDFRYSAITGSLTVQGNARLRLTNNVNSITLGNNTSIIIQSGASLTVYAQGGIDADANNVDLNNANDPKAKNFIYYMYGTSTSPITIKNSSSAYMAIYAPDASAITFKNGGDFFGSVIGKTVEFQNNSNIHYDEDLYNYGAGGLGTGTNFQIRTWEEMPN